MRNTHLELGKMQGANPTLVNRTAETGENLECLTFDIHYSLENSFEQLVVQPFSTLRDFSLRNFPSKSLLFQIKLKT